MSNRYVIFGPPGSGKTTSLVKRIERAVTENKGYGGDMLIGSLTRTAAHEIASRVKAKCPGVEFPHVGTVHALALRALRAIGEPTALVYEPEHIEDFNRTYRRSLPRELGRLLYESEARNYDMKRLAEIDRLRAAEMPISSWPESATNLYNQWTAWKDAHGLMDFTDIIVRATAVCRVHPANPSYIFMDEAQDLSRLEMRLIKQWAEGTSKTIIAGDDQQALYEWRGASVRDFIDFAPEENTHVLPNSFRMRRAIYEHAVGVGDRISQRKDKQFHPKAEGGEVVRLNKFALLNSLIDDAEAGRTVMLLATCGYMLDPWLMELRKLGVPFHNPYRVAQEGKTWNPMECGDARALRTFLGPSRGQQMWTWQQLYDVTKHLENVTVMSEIVKRKSSHAVADIDGLPEEFLRAAQAGDVDAYFDLMSQRARVARRGLTPLGYLRRVVHRCGHDALFRKPNLIVGTVHSVKGGEADVVYLLPYLSPEAHLALARSAAGRDSVLRTMYVGVSRAKDKLVLVTDLSKRRRMW